MTCLGPQRRHAAERGIVSSLQDLETYDVLYPGRCPWAFSFRTVGALKGMGLPKGAMGIRMAALRYDTIAGQALWHPSRSGLLGGPRDSA